MKEYQAVMEPTKPRVRPKIRVLEEGFDLRNLETNVIVEQLEYNKALRETPIPEQIKQKLRRASGQ